MSKVFDALTVIDRLNMLARSKGTSANKALTECGFKDLIANLRKGSIPSVDKFLIISDYFNINVGWLLTGKGEIDGNTGNDASPDTRLLNNFYELNEKERALVLERIQSFLDLKKIPKHQTDKEKPLLESDKPISEPLCVPEIEALKIDMRVYDEHASAGLGDYLYGDSTYDVLSVNEDAVPPRATIGIRIAGNSMEPSIPDKSIVWVEEMTEIPNGQIGIFILNNKVSFCKKLKIDYDKREVCLISCNPKYEPIKISEYDFLRTIGKVIGTPYVL